MPHLRAAPLLVAAALAGCQAPPPQLSLEQRLALESRRFDPPRDAVVRAAATTLLDAGYIIRSSDFEAGLVCGERRAAYAQEAHYARGGGLGAPASLTDLAVVWVHADGPGAGARLHLESCGAPLLDPEAYAAFWRQLDARLLPKEAAR